MGGLDTGFVGGAFMGPPSERQLGLGALAPYSCLGKLRWPQVQSQLSPGGRMFQPESFKKGFSFGEGSLPGQPARVREPWRWESVGCTAGAKGEVGLGLSLIHI